jgi:MFS family permease
VAVTALCLVQFVDVLGVTVVVTALPSMLTDLHAAQSLGSLIATGYAMFFGGLLMLGARLGDRYGHRRTIFASLAVFAAGAVVAATASSIVTLTAGRCLQGAAAAASVPSALRLLTSITAEGPARRQAIAAWSAAGAAAGASGFVIGGIVTDLTSWRVIFWAYVPLAVVLGLAIAASVPPDPGRPAARSLNLAGSAAFTGAVMALVVGLTIITRPAGRLPGALLLGGCAVLAAAFARIDRRAAAPLLPRPLLRARPLRLGALGGFLNTATTSSVITLVTLYLQDTLRRSPLAAAATLLPFSLAVIAGSGLSATLQRVLRPTRVVAAGLAVITLADLALILAAPAAWAIALCAAAGGLGIGLSSVAATGLGTDVALRWRGAASGVINTAAQLGTAVGVAALLLIAAVTSGVPSGDTGPPRAAWAVGAAVAAAGAIRFALAARPSQDADPALRTCVVARRVPHPATVRHPGGRSLVAFCVSPHRTGNQGHNRPYCDFGLLRTHSICRRSGYGNGGNVISGRREPILAGSGRFCPLPNVPACRRTPFTSR